MRKTAWRSRVVRWGPAPVAPLACALAACGGAAPSDLLDADAAVSSSADAGSGSRDSGPTADARPDATAGDPGVRCPSAGSCEVPDQVCCKSAQGDSCVGAGSCPALSIPCDDTADCEAAGMTGKVCCLVNGPDGIASSVQCLSPNDCQPSQGRTTLCNPQAAASCPSGQTCLPSEKSLPGFDICR
jgi:hypothetical protein